MNDSHTVLRLEPPSAAWLPAFLTLAQEFAATDEPRYAMALRDPAAYLEQLAQRAAGADLPTNRVSETTFWAVRGDAVLAVSRLRHQPTPTLEQIGGHIGYEVRPSARLHGIGTQLLALTLSEARALGLLRVLITCDVSNHGSARIIEYNGDQLEDARLVPGHPEPIARYWIERAVIAPTGHAAAVQSASRSRRGRGRCVPASQPALCRRGRCAARV